MSDLVGNPEDRFSRVAAQIASLRLVCPNMGHTDDETAMAIRQAAELKFER